MTVTVKTVIPPGSMDAVTSKLDLRHSPFNLAPSVSPSSYNRLQRVALGGHAVRKAGEGVGWLPLNIIRIGLDFLFSPRHE